MGARFISLKRSHNTPSNDPRPAVLTSGHDPTVTVARNSLGQSISLYSASSAEEDIASSMSRGSTTDSSADLTYTTSPLHSPALLSAGHQRYPLASPLIYTPSVHCPSSIAPQRTYCSSSLVYPTPDRERPPHFTEAKIDRDLHSVESRSIGCAVMKTWIRAFGNCISSLSGMCQ
ncbi:hypothetical protein CBS101457_004373 [Exobasidium rhododendri]|nr:hypothetical protein CBS101457_004373 [Exobasidium rhododendri]